jgi:cytochrome c biogenesis protein ResB
MQLPLRLFIEVIVAMLGGMILWLALASHRIPDRHASSWLMVGVLLMVWGVFTFFRARGLRSYWVDRVSGISLLLVGGLMLAMTRVPFALVMPMFAAVGGLLVLRGLTGVVLVSRRN